MIDIIILAIVLIPYLSLLSQRIKTLGQSYYSKHPLKTISIAAAYLILPWVALHFSVGTDLLLELPLIIAYVVIPILLQHTRNPNQPRCDIRDILTILILWIPIELEWFTQPSITQIPIQLLQGINTALIAMMIMQPKESTAAIGYHFHWEKKDVRIALTTFVVILTLILPLGLITKFIEFRPEPLGLSLSIGAFLYNYLLIGMSEELLFRGMIFYFLLSRFPNTPLISWGISSVLFGIAHINNPTYGWSPPNYLYVCLAFIAGLGYMWVWKKTGKITVSALTHALVNATWVTLFLYE